MSDALYRMIWRWHFFSALVFVPFMIILALSGAIYLFVDEYEGLALSPYLKSGDPAAMASGPGESKASLDAQLRRVRQGHPGYRVGMIIERKGYNTEFQLHRVSDARDGDDGNGEGVLPSNWSLRSGEPPGSLSVFVDPVSGYVLGEVDNDVRFMRLVKRLHGELLMGGFGTKFVELAANWGILIITMGLVLWWTRRGGRLRDRFLPNLSRRGRSLWRDLHSVTGLYVFVPLMFLLVTGLPWTDVWGGWFKSMQRAVGQSAPASFFDRTLRSWPHAATSPITLDEVIAIAHAHGLDGYLKIRMPRGEDGAFNILRESTDPAERVVLQLDQYSGKPIRIGRWQDSPPLEKAVALGIKIHRGEYFGRANQFAGLATALALVFVCVSGIVVWLKRRPKGRLAAPPRPATWASPRWLVVTTLVMACLLPLLGLSLLLYLFVDLALQRLRVWHLSYQ